MTGPTWAESWDFGAGTTNWDDGLNWDTDAVPTGSNPVGIKGFSEAQSPIITDLTSAISIPEFQIGAFMGTGFLTVSGGSVATTSNFFVGMFTDGIGTVTQNSGAVTAGDGLVLGFDNNAQGTYNLTGGTLNVAHLTSLGAGNSAGNTGNFNQSGGTFTGENFHIGSYGNNRTGTLMLSDAASMTLTGDMEIGFDGGFATGNSGALILDGSKTGAGTNLSLDELKFGTVGTFVVYIDDDAILNPLNLHSVDANFADFNAGSLLDLDFALGTTPTVGTWTLVTAGININDFGLALAPGVDAGWSFEIVSLDGGGEALQVTYVPEPSTIAMFAAGLGTVLVLRRRQPVS